MESVGQLSVEPPAASTALSSRAILFAVLELSRFLAGVAKGLGITSRKLLPHSELSFRASPKKQTLFALLADKLSST